MVKRRARFLAPLALAAGAMAACGQLLGIEAVHDDPADAGGAPIDGSLPRDAGGDRASPGDGAPLESSAPDASDGASPPEGGPVIDPARGCTAPDGAAVPFFSNVSTFPVGLAIDPAGIYIGDYNSIRRCSIEGCDGGITTVYPTRPDGLTATAAHLVYCATGVVTIADRNGTGVQTFVSQGGCAVMRARGADLFWAIGPRIVHAVDGLDAGSQTVLIDDYGDPVALAPTSRWAFFLDKSDPDASTARVARCDLPGCDAGVVVFGAASNETARPPSPPLIAANEQTVYWVDPGTRQIFSCSTDGCDDAGPRVVVADASVSGLYADETGLYWADAPGETSLIGSVYKTAADGGGTTVLSTGHRAASNFVSNAACVYWTDEGFIPSNDPGEVWGVRQP